MLALDIYPRRIRNFGYIHHGVAPCIVDFASAHYMNGTNIRCVLYNHSTIAMKLRVR